MNKILKILLVILFFPIYLPLYLILYILLFCMPYSDPANIKSSFFNNKKRINYFKKLYRRNKTPDQYLIEEIPDSITVPNASEEEIENQTNNEFDNKFESKLDKDFENEIDTNSINPSVLEQTKTSNVTNSPFPNSANEFLVIGAGFIGLSTAATMKKYGIPYRIVDKNSEIGGNWYNGVYESVHIISSKKTTEYKDFPMPESYPDFPSHSQMFNYLKSYQIHNKLEVSLNCKVEDLKFSKQENNGWRVKLSIFDQPILFKGVIVCDGHHSIPRFPKFPQSKDQFEGIIVHSKEITKDLELFEGKSVCIIGGGNSACDLAVLAARYGKESHVSLRRGYWFIPRTAFGVPIVELLRPWMPSFIQKILLHVLLKIVNGNNKDYGMETPDYSIYGEKHPTINSELLQFIKLGRIKPHGEIKEFLGGKKVQFMDGKIEEIDIIVCATGYHHNHPLLNKYMKYEDNLPLLIGSVVVPSSLREGNPDSDLQYVSNLENETNETNEANELNLENDSSLLNKRQIASNTNNSSKNSKKEMKKYGLGERNLYCQGIVQVRYGVGPCITFGSEILIQILCLQEVIPHNIGHFLRKIGLGGFPERSKRSADILRDPYELWGILLVARSILPWLPTLYNLLKRFSVTIPEHIEVPGNFMEEEWIKESAIDFTHLKR